MIDSINRMIYAQVHIKILIFGSLLGLIKEKQNRENSFHFFYYSFIHFIVFSGRLTGAQGILLFYNYLPDKCLTVKPNENTNNCVKIESLTSDILDAARKIIIRKEKSGHESTVTSLEVDHKLESLTSANEQLRQKVTRLEQKIDEQNRKLDLILTKL